jgi:ubiquinone/menaquinone biosynthesis C-methylase UbiE
MTICISRWGSWITGNKLAITGNSENNNSCIYKGLDRMSATEIENDYWKIYWSNVKVSDNDNLHSQVERTVNKVPIDEKKWQFTLTEIVKAIDLQPSDNILDLCSGNGLISVPFSQKCKLVTAVDISESLLSRIDTIEYANITVISGDARKISLGKECFSKAVMYSSLQHFSERETIGIFKTVFQSLKAGGVFLAGDIPDLDRLFNFYSKQEWERAYFESVENNTPAVGTWYKKEVLVKMANYVGFSEAKIIDQHPDLINSHCRFDLLLTK